MLAGEVEQDHRFGLITFSAHSRASVTLGMRQHYCRNVPALSGKVECLLDKAVRSINVSKRPEHPSKVVHGSNTGVVAESGCRMMRSLVVVDCHSLFEVPTRAAVVAPEPAGRAEQSVANTGLQRARPVLRITHEGLSRLEHRRELPANEASNPEAP